MQLVKIPQKLAKKGDLVVIPRTEYEELLSIQDKHKKFYDDLDRDLDKAIKSYKAGRYYGPFKSAKESQLFFESKNKKKR